MDLPEFKKRFNVQLNPQQEMAVMKVKGPTLLLAVPGSGKTTVIVSKIGYMDHCCGIRPETILTLTFSKAAALEMEGRFLAKFGAGGGGQPVFGTIHSFCLSILRKAQREKGIQIPKLEPNSSKILRRVYFEATKSYPSESDISELQQVISFCKNMMYSHDQVAAIKLPGIDFEQIYLEYEEFKDANGLMDFDDQLTFAYDLIEGDPSFLRGFKARYKYLNVDEAQDTSYIQHKLIEKLVGDEKNIFMVGDEDQSIYGFRGAYPEALTKFSEVYPDAEVLLIEKNYRCASAISAAAGEFIKRNRFRYPKNMEAERDGGEISELRLTDLKHQYNKIIEDLTKDKDTGASTAVLYRNNESAIPFVDMLEKRGIPYTWSGGKSFFDNFVVKDLCAALRLAIDGRDINAYGEIYYKLGLYTRKARYQHLILLHRKQPQKAVLDILGEITEQDTLKERTYEISRMLKKLGKGTPIQALDGVLRLFYNEWMRKLCDEDGYSPQTLRQKIVTLYAVAMEYKTVDEYMDRLAHLSNKRERKMEDGEQPLVALSTIHSSKGLEFDRVILVDVLKNVLPVEGRPSTSAEDDEELYSEEVRLFYVGITRARDEVLIVTSDKRFGDAISMSPFVAAILGKGFRGKETPRIQAPKPVVFEGFDGGAEVLHAHFGKGKIISNKNDVVVIRFEKGGEKRLLLSACLEWGYLSKLN